MIGAIILAVFGLSVLHFLAKIVYMMVLRKYHAYLFRNLPGPILSPFGYEYTENFDRLHEWRTEILLSYPGARAVKFSGMNCQIFTTHPETVQFALKDGFDVCVKPDASQNYVYQMLREWLGDGIFLLKHGSNAPDEHLKWLKHRKTAVHMFKQTNFKTLMHDSFVEKSQQLRGSLQDGAVVDIQRKFLAFTMDSTMEIFFGHNSNTLAEDHQDTFSLAFDNAHIQLMEFIFGNLDKILISALLPWPWGGLSLSPQVNLGLKLYRQSNKHAIAFEKNCQLLRATAKSIIAARKDDPDLSSKRDLLALFLSTTNIDGEEFSEKELIDMLLNFVIAGRDTTASTLSWMFYILSQNMDVQDRLCAEIDDKLGDSEITLDSVSATHMPYLNGVIYETLRLYPPVPFDNKFTSEGVDLPGGTYLPPNCEITFSPYAMGRDPDRYSEPYAVKPERWIPFAQPSPYEFPVFQAGPRICLGMNMALFEAKVCAATLLQQFKFHMKAVEAEKITYGLGVTMGVRNGKDRDDRSLFMIPEKRF